MYSQVAQNDQLDESPFLYHLPRIIQRWTPSKENTETKAVCRNECVEPGTEELT